MASYCKLRNLDHAIKVLYYYDSYAHFINISQIPLVHSCCLTTKEFVVCLSQIDYNQYCPNSGDATLTRVLIVVHQVILVLVTTGLPRPVPQHADISPGELSLSYWEH